MFAQGVQIVEVDEGHDGQRLDNYLLKILGPSVPKSLIYRIIRKGEVRINKGRVRANTRVQMGDNVRIPPVERRVKQTYSVPGKLITLFEQRILLEDDQLLILNKPSGIPVHGGTSQKFGVMDVVKAMRPELKFIELAHRLDKGTSGCLILAKTRKMLLELQDLFRSGEINKRYLTLTRGRWLAKEIKVDALLLKIQQGEGERVVKVSSLGKSAQSIFKVQKIFANASLVEVTILTGRTHQIRVHAAYKNHPVAADEKYGDDEFNRKMKDLGLKRMFLHAYRLQFYLKSIKRRVIIDAPLDIELKHCLAQLEKLK